ncbi:CDP-alcohol phosphatidyltransferase family protein [Porphyromonas sp. oral taxon 275]|uniref:CDP-alcohol phosphatidyltransferase family protein n=1 Tax=Porphyromonas sp. oral taxon 275 TaxID=712435 RepID=UPI001BA5FBFE|nr:CDP-alcohol phosphatidyltransferase family protein [Porphyromonas sp. oral taxon 275]QUB43561.1 CDP-alcohol phosphatidyltransferase family protein [Porphyromonas sp. oral taxon 275]
MSDTKKSISQDRKRTNVLHTQELALIAYLVERMPRWVTSNMLTTIGLCGNLLVALFMLLGALTGESWWLLLTPLGFAINWFGDSLDGRLAYYRGKPRKWFGFCLDIVVDWIGIVAIGLGYYSYVAPEWKLVGFIFVALYGAEMIISQLRYKVTDRYSIDSGLLGPTEVRIILALLFSSEYFFPGSIQWIGLAISVVLLIAFLTDFAGLLALANERDAAARLEQKEKHSSES